MSALYKLGLGLLALVLAFGAGRFSHKPAQSAPLTVTQTQTKIETQVVDHVVKQIVREIVRVPGGKVVEKVTETVTEQKTAAKEQVTAAKSVAAVSSPAPNWSLGVTWQPRLDPGVYVPTGAEIGRRVLGDIWATGGLDWRSHAATVGVKVEW